MKAGVRVSSTCCRFLCITACLTGSTCRQGMSNILIQAAHARAKRVASQQLFTMTATIFLSRGATTLLTPRRWAVVLGLVIGGLGWCADLCTSSPVRCLSMPVQRVSCRYNYQLDVAGATVCQQAARNTSGRKIAREGESSESRRGTTVSMRARPVPFS